MNNRENIIGMYRRTGYRSAPVEFNMSPVMWEKFNTAAKGRTLEQYVDYPGGFCMDSVPGPELKPAETDWSRFFSRDLAPGTTFEYWGIAHEPGSADAHHMTRMVHPMAGFTSLEQMQAYPWPQLNDTDLDAMKIAADAAHAQGRAGGGYMACTIWETAWYMRDMPTLMMDMSMGDEKAVYLLDRITDYACRRAAAYAKAGTDIIHLGDDIGMQHTVMMSLDMYREWLKPRLAQVIAVARRHKPDVLIFYHSCGFIEPFIEDLIEVGVDILDPVQPECMSFEVLHAQYGNRLSFHGTLGTQTTMPFGSAADVRAATLRNLEIAGRSGGLMAAPTHMLEPEVPWENVLAYVEACKEYSKAGG